MHIREPHPSSPYYIVHRPNYTCPFYCTNRILEVKLKEEWLSLDYGPYLRIDNVQTRVGPG